MTSEDTPARSSLAEGAPLMIGAVVAGVTAWLGRTGRLPRQPWVGIRLPSTMRSDETWRAAQAAGSAPVIGGSLVAFALGAVMALRRLDRSTASLIGRCAGAALVAGAIAGALRGRRAARRVP